MKLLDEEGNLFGVVNIVDALAILFVVAVIVAGVTFVTGSGGDNDEEQGPAIESTHITLDLGEQPIYVASAIQAGDMHSAGGDSQLTLTDVYLAPQRNQARVIARAQLQGPMGEGGLSYANAPPRLDRTLQVATDHYQVNGRIRAVGGNETLTRSESEVVLDTTMNTRDAADVTPGDEVRIGGRTVATIETVTRYATQNPDRTRVVVGASLQTVAIEGNQQFGAVPLQKGSELTLDVGEYTLSGPIQRTGTTEPQGSVATRTVTLRMGPVREEIAESIEPGMTERSGDITVAQVTGVDVEPSLITTIDENGSVNVAEHPLHRDVTLTTELRVWETESDVQFKGQSLRQNQTVIIHLETITIRATIVSVRA